VPLENKQGFFLACFLTAPYAASKKQPISSGCFLEWRLADVEKITN
jgi:hypothetical protein